MPRKDEREPFYRIDVAEAKDMLSQDDVVVIDVREPHEYQTGHVPSASLIPVNGTSSGGCTLSGSGVSVRARTSTR